MTLFEKIISREIPAKIAFEDEEVLVIPKRVIPRIAEAQPADGTLLGRLLLTAKQIAADLGLSESGFRLVINSGRNGGETVPHLHVHLLGGRPMHWPPG
jgi:histidine triad (HIT) family protein